MCIVTELYDLLLSQMIGTYSIKIKIRAEEFNSEESIFPQTINFDLIEGDRSLCSNKKLDAVVFTGLGKDN